MQFVLRLTLEMSEQLDNRSLRNATARRNNMQFLGDIASAWASFTDTLNSRGGTIALLFLSCCVLGFALLHGWHGDAETVSLIRNTFSGFAGALLIALTSKDKNGNGSSNPPGGIAK